MSRPWDQEFEEFARQHYRAVVGHLVKRGLSEPNAEDAAQEALSGMYPLWPEEKRLPTAPRWLIGWGRWQSPLAACPWVLHALARLASSAGNIMVVADADAMVLWRAGDPEVLRCADEVGFVTGAHWDLAHASVGGIALALSVRQHQRQHAASAHQYQAEGAEPAAPWAPAQAAPSAGRVEQSRQTRVGGGQLSFDPFQVASFPIGQRHDPPPRAHPTAARFLIGYRSRLE